LEIGLELTEAGRGAGLGAVAKKSSPRSESAGFVGFGGTGELLVGGWLLDDGGTEVDLAGWGERSSSSMRLIFCLLTGS
jgi:hypothetical protein